MDEIDKLLLSYGETLVSDIKKNIPNATGKTSRSLEYKVVNDKGKKSLLIYGRKYFAALETGRKPRQSSNISNPSLSHNILEWMDAKGMAPDLPDKKRENLARFIAYRINKFGTKLFQSGGRNDVFSEPFKKLTDKLQKEISQPFLNGVRAEIEKTWNTREQNYGDT